MEETSMQAIYTARHRTMSRYVDDQVAVEDKAVEEDSSERNSSEINVRRSDSEDVDKSSLQHDLVERRRKLYFLSLIKGAKRYMRNVRVICV